MDGYQLIRAPLKMGTDAIHWQTWVQEPTSASAAARCRMGRVRLLADRSSLSPPRAVSISATTSRLYVRSIRRSAVHDDLVRAQTHGKASDWYENAGGNLRPRSSGTTNPPLSTAQTSIIKSAATKSAALLRTNCAPPRRSHRQRRRGSRGIPVFPNPSTRHRVDAGAAAKR